MIEFGEFQTLVSQFAEGKLKKAVHSEFSRYVRNHTAAGESEERVLREIFEKRITPLTNQKKWFRNRGGGEPYRHMIANWAGGDGSYPLAVAAYYWLHVEPADKEYARGIDLSLLQQPFHEWTGGRTVAGDTPPPRPRLKALRIADVQSPVSRFATLNDIVPNAAAFIRHAAGSGFEFHDLINAARDELFVCGQNLFGLVKENDGAATLDHISKAVQRGVKVRMMMCHPGDEDHIDKWAFAVGAADYGDHLQKSASIIRTWPAKFQKGEVEVRFAKFIPTSITFVDPFKLDARFAVFTPHHYNPVRTERPLIVLSHHADPELFDQFFSNYKYIWEHTRSVEN